MCENPADPARPAPGRIGAASLLLRLRREPRAALFALLTSLAAGLAPLAAALVPSAATASPLAVARTATGAPIAIPVAVFGKDDRRPLNNRHRALRDYIGLLHHRDTGNVCSAFCLATDVIATAGHCVQSALDGTGTGFENLRFATDAARHDSTIGSGGAAVAGTAAGLAMPQVIVGATQLNTRPPINATSDWALLRLASPACRSGGLPLTRLSPTALATQARAGKVFHVSYHRDFRDWELAASAPCHAAADYPSDIHAALDKDFADAQGLVLHDCDTGAASSGSPLLVETVNGPEVAGINVGTYVRSRVITHDGEVIQRLSSETIANTALFAETLRAPLAALEHADPLASGTDVQLLEQRLKARGLFAGEPDATYDAETRAAVMAYEKARGVTVTGLATLRLVDALGGETAAAR